MPLTPEFQESGEQRFLMGNMRNCNGANFKNKISDILYLVKSS